MAVGIIIHDDTDPPVHTQPAESQSRQPQRVSSDPNPLTAALQAKPIPLCYGTAKLPLLLIEKFAPTVGDYPAWVAAHVYSVGDRVTSNGNVYEVDHASVGTSGTSGPGPAGPGDAAGHVQDGSVIWHFEGVNGGTCTWLPNHTYGAGATVVCNGGSYLRYSGGTSGSATHGAGPGFTDAIAHLDGLNAAGSPPGLWWKYVQALPLPVYKQNFVGALCEGAIAGALQLYWDKERLTANSLTSLPKGLTVSTGPDAANTVLPVSPAYDTCGYQHTALVYPTTATSCFTGTQAEIPDVAVETSGVLLGSSSADVNPADIIYDLLTHARRGCAWPSSRLGGFYGSAADSLRVYCDAFGLRMSMVVDSQRSAASILADILAACNADAVWSGGTLKIVPLGDTASTSPVYGATNYVPSNVAAFNLTADDFLDQTQPVQVSRRSATDCFNAWPVEYSDRGQDYVRTTVEDPDMSDVDQRGLLRAPVTTLPVIFPTGAPAIMLSRIFAQRSLHVRNTYRFRLGWKYGLLEPTDIVTLTDAATGLSLTPVRITETEESEDGINITAEDYPAGVAAAVSYAPQAGDGYTPSEAATLAHTQAVFDPRANFCRALLASQQYFGLSYGTHVGTYGWNIVCSFATALYDYSSMFNGTNHTITIPVNGYYQVRANLWSSFTLSYFTSIRAVIQLTRGGVTSDLVAASASYATPDWPADVGVGTDYVALLAGDILAVRIDTVIASDAAIGIVYSDPAHTYFYARLC